jgi:hypothetical protein
MPSNAFALKFKNLRNLYALWTVDYIRNIDSDVISYNDDDEDQNVQPGDVLNGEYKDELSLDNWVYDGHSIDDIPDYGDVALPLKDMYALFFIRMNRVF